MTKIQATFALYANIDASRERSKYFSHSSQDVVSTVTQSSNNNDHALESVEIPWEHPPKNSGGKMRAQSVFKREKTHLFGQIPHLI